MTVADEVRRMCRTQWFHVLGVCLITAIVVASVITAMTDKRFVIVVQHSLVHSLTMGALCWATLSFFIVPRVRVRGFGVQWTVTIGTLLGLAVIGTATACEILRVFPPQPVSESFRECFNSVLGINALLATSLGIGMSLYQSQREQIAALSLELRTRELERERAMKAALEARLASLESRLQPHFLFNTLNAISSLIEEDPARAERTVERLAALLRFSLDGAERGVVSLAHELDVVADYLEIERTRFGERLAYEIDADPAVKACAVPPLAVQTLVENSVKYAIGPRPSGGRIRVTAAAAGDHIVASVWDDGPGFALDAARAGHGLDMLRSRLAARFGDAASITVTRAGGGTLVAVAVPRTLPGDA
ncbi:MAG: histidine kinase [Candidatus Rokubacteria bacterium]|nr:histidine kinase [Candidatus Rokubacteria bacterium]